MNPPLPHLTIQQLIYLQAIDKHETWGAAAKSLDVSPSALSQGISELERRLQVQLFVRQGRRRIPTDHAHIAIAYAHQVLAETQDLARWAEETRLGHAGRLQVGMIDVAAVAYFPDALRQFQAAYPRVDIQLSVAPSRLLVDRVRAGHLAFALVVDPGQPLPGCTTTPLMTEDLAIYAPTERANNDPTTWGPWVLFPASSHTRQLTTQALHSLGAPVQVAAESNQPDVLREMVRLGMGWTVLPTEQAERTDRPLNRVRPQPLLQRQLVVARRPNALTNPASQLLLAALLAAAP